MHVLEEAELRELLFPDTQPCPVQKNLEQLLRETLHTEGSLVLGGVGTFRLSEDGHVEFEPWTRKRVFLAYACEDSAAVTAIYRFLLRQSFDPWMDTQRLLPGQNWPCAIERAIELADFVVPCFSRTSSKKRGHFQTELRLALEASQRLPLETTYLIPLRLEECRVPKVLQRQTQYLDLFPDFKLGLQKLQHALLAEPPMNGS